MNNSKPTQCLNMIVKNEAHIILKTLNSVLKAFNIDTWVIHYTGYTDGTQQIIKDTLAHIPGKLIEKAWVDFGTNRQIALKSAEGLSTYILFVDANQEFECKCPDFDQDADAVTLMSRLGSTLYPLISIVNNNRSWKQRGVVHEVLHQVDKSVKKKHIGPL